MNIACVIGSRADMAGMLAIHGNLADNVRHIVTPGESLDGYTAAILIGDRYEVAQMALKFREMLVPFAHVHAGDITGQEPDDTYRDVITRMSTWRLCANKDAANTLRLKGHMKNVYVTGSPYISAIAQAQTADISWPDGDGKKVLILCNPLPESPRETKDIAIAVAGLIDRYSARYIAVSPNTDRNSWMIRHTIGRSCKMYDSLTHPEYSTLLKSADVIIGNTSAGLIENSYYGTPYICVGTRQWGRVGGNHVLWCSHLDAIDKMLEEALGRPKRPNHSYGDINSAMRIASVLMEQLRVMN